MKALFLSVVIFQLLIIILTKEEKYEFGDLISFPRVCLCINGTSLYKHYALYVDNEYPGKGDIIHRIGNPRGNDIQFGQLKTQGEHQKETIPDFPKQDKEDIKRRIKAALKNCDVYNLKSNNCEHFAAYLQTGNGTAHQRGTIASIYYRLFPCKREKDCTAWNKYVEEIKQNERTEENCSDCVLGG